MSRICIKHFAWGCLLLLAVCCSSLSAEQEDKSAVIQGIVTDSSGQFLDDYIIILANTRMSMINKTIYSGHSPFEAPIGKACQWQAIITDFSHDTIRTILYDTEPGSFRIDWDEKNNNGEHMEDGVYSISVESPMNRLNLGTWAIWNYSDPGVAMPLFFKKYENSEFTIDDIVVGPDTLNIFYHYIMHKVEIGTPYDLFCFKKGYQKELQKIELKPGDTTKVSFVLKQDKRVTKDRPGR